MEHLLIHDFAAMVNVDLDQLLSSMLILLVSMFCSMLILLVSMLEMDGRKDG